MLVGGQLVHRVHCWDDSLVSFGRISPQFTVSETWCLALLSSRVGTPSGPFTPRVQAMRP